MKENNKLLLWLIGIAVFGFAMFQIIPYLMDRFNVGTEWITLVFILGVIIIPQVNVHHTLRVWENLQETDEIDFGLKKKALDWIPFLNDWELTRLYNDGNLVNAILSWVLRISSILLPLSLLYLNLLIVWVDLGYDITIAIKYVSTYLLYGYFISKAGIVIHLLINTNANFWYSLILGVTIFPGLMYLNYMAKVYILNQTDDVYDKRLGEEYE